MGKIFLFILLICFAGNVKAQSINSIKKLLIDNKLLEAKTEVENLLAIPDSSNNSYAWYFKGFIYNLLSKDSSTNLPLTNSKAIAFNAFTKCLSITPKHKWLAKDNYAPLFDIYISFFEKGKQDFVKNNYDAALENFLNAEKVGQYLFEQKINYKQFSFTAMDTSLLFNIATSAIKANKEKEGIFYYVRIAEKQLKDPSYIPIYHALVDYFVSINDEIGFRKYLKIGRALYPYDNYWVQAELDMVNAGKLNDALIKEHLTKIKGNNNDFSLHYNFANDLIQILYGSENKVKRFEEWKNTLEEQLKKCLLLQKSGNKTEYLYTIFYYKDANLFDFKKSEEEKLSYKKEQYQKAIPYATILFEEYEKNNKLNRYQLDQYKQIAKMLLEMHTLNGNTDIVKEYESKMKDIDLLLPVYVTKKPN